MELVNNLAHEQQSDAWADLAANEQELGVVERPARLAGQLVQTLESALVLLAGSQAANSNEYVRLTENVYVSIGPLDQQNGSSKPIEVSLPIESSLLGTKWMGASERLTLHLQASGLSGSQANTANSIPSLTNGGIDLTLLANGPTRQVASELSQPSMASTDSSSGGNGAIGESGTNSPGKLGITLKVRACL